MQTFLNWRCTTKLPVCNEIANAHSSDQQAQGKPRTGPPGHTARLTKDRKNMAPSHPESGPICSPRMSCSSRRACRPPPDRRLHDWQHCVRIRAPRCSSPLPHHDNALMHGKQCHDMLHGQYRTHHDIKPECIPLPICTTDTRIQVKACTLLTCNKAACRSETLEDKGTKRSPRPARRPAIVVYTPHASRDLWRTGRMQFHGTCHSEATAAWHCGAP
eukprot:364639-Chlamydomonas_euryale.AAC.41